MKKENVSFMLYLILGIPLAVIGPILIILFNIGYLDVRYLVIGIILYIFGVVLIYLMRTNIPSINFEIKNQKIMMRFFVTFSWIWLLMGLTVSLYIIVLSFVSLNQGLSTFYYIIFAGFSGGLWGMGLTEVYNFSNFAKYGKDFSSKFDWSKEGGRIDWYKPKSFKKNLLIWIRSFIFVILFWVFIIFIIAIKF